MKTTFKKSIKFYTALAVIIFIITFYAQGCFAKNLIPIGKTVGISVELSGATVVSLSEFETSDGQYCSPAKDAGIKSGDVIIRINDTLITSSKELPEPSGKEELEILIRRDGREESVKVYPQKDVSDGNYKIGVWLKDIASGIGTLTYYDPETQQFGALGHGICENNLELIDITKGKIIDAEIASVNKGEKGKPGELIGIFSERGAVLGEVFENSPTGIYGKANSEFKAFVDEKSIETANRSEIFEGDAEILSNVHGKEVEKYSAKILKINNDETAAKSIILKITDKRLIENTGGIVQGMSGSPIIQNGKLVGAVTHVFVNDPTRGYGIFIENMLAEAEKII